MKIKESAATARIMLIFLIIGCLMLCGGIAFGVYFKIISNRYEKIEATITEVTIYHDSYGDDQYYVTVDYEYNGIEYHDIPINFYSSGMYEGKVINVMCNKDDPTKLRSSTLWIVLPTAFLGMGLLFSIPALAFLRKVHVKKSLENQIRKNGEVLFCKITSIIPDTSYRVNGRLVNNIVVCVPLDEDYSEPFVSNPYNKKYSVDIGSTVKVYRDRDNHENYYVDLNSIESPTTYEINNFSSNN